MIAAIDAPGRSLVELAMIGRGLHPGDIERYGTICPDCLSIGASVTLARHPARSVAAFACTCGRERIADVDAPDRVDSQP